MNLHVLAAIARADFLERVRTYAFLVTLAAVLWLGYGTYTGFVSVQISDHRGVLNSAWVGGMSAVVAISFLSLAGLYVVRNSVRRDRITGVGQILATTPLSRASYTLGKALSNFLVLVAMVSVLVVTALALQLVGGEDRKVDLLGIVLPFVLCALPAMAMVAAIAVAFETLPGLSGGFGNVIWIFIWSALVVTSFERASVLGDATGMRAIMDSMRDAAKAQLPGYQPTFSVTMDPGQTTEGTFLWTGVQWSIPFVLSRVAWLGAAVLLTLAAAIPFDRFDPSRNRWAPWARRRPGAVGAVETPDGADIATPATSAVKRRRRGFPRVPSIRLPGIVGAELKLLTGGVNRWWALVGVGLWIASLLTPLAISHSSILTALWIWPVLLWSRLGSRDRRWNTEAFLFVSTGALTRQLPASWIAGALLGLGLSSGVMLRLLLAGDPGSLAAIVVGALFAPAAALALGVWSGGSKLFEVLYSILWYLGPANRGPSLDFIGATRSANAVTTHPATWLVLAGVLFAAAFVGRWRQIRG